MNSKWFDRLKKEFVQGYTEYCGLRAEKVESGIFESRIQIKKEHKQQDGFVHAGVIATIADHTAGYAAFTLVPEDIRILTIEFKINYFKPAVGDTVICRSKVINRGKKIIVSESKVFVSLKGNEKLISKALVTLMAVPEKDLLKKQTG